MKSRNNQKSFSHRCSFLLHSFFLFFFFFLFLLSFFLLLHIWAWIVLLFIWRFFFLFVSVSLPASQAKSFPLLPIFLLKNSPYISIYLMFSHIVVSQMYSACVVFCVFPVIGQRAGRYFLLSSFLFHLFYNSVPRFAFLR